MSYKKHKVGTTEWKERQEYLVWLDKHLEELAEKKRECVRKINSARAGVRGALNPKKYLEYKREWRARRKLKEEEDERNGLEGDSGKDLEKTKT